jgi:hypothetical protein
LQLDQQAAAHAARIEQEHKYWSNEREKAEITLIGTALDANKIRSENATREYYAAQDSGDYATMQERDRIIPIISKY